MSGTNVTSTATVPSVQFPVVIWWKVFFDHTFFAHYLPCMIEHNWDGSTPLSLDVPQQYHIYWCYLRNQLSFSKHAKACAADLANTYGLKDPSVVWNGIVTKNLPNQWLNLPSNFFSVQFWEKGMQKITSDFFQLPSYFCPDEHVSNDCLCFLPEFLYDCHNYRT